MATRDLATTHLTDVPPELEERLRYAKVLVELGDLSLAELEVAEVLDVSPEHPEALSLFAKLKHMRRQLSLAVACSAQLQSRRPGSGQQARMHLESMLHLAQNPTQGAGEFLAMGQFQLVQKPTAYLALEEAFRLYVARRPNEARPVRLTGEIGLASGRPMASAREVLRRVKPAQRARPG